MQGEGAIVKETAMTRDLPNPEAVFAQAVEIESPAARAAFLDQACCNDPELRREVGKLVIDHYRAGEFLERGGVADRVKIVEGDARETIPTVGGPFDLLFVDATKAEYREYIELAEPKLAPRALMVVDNLLMSGDVAAPPGAQTTWPEESLASARALNSELVGGEGWVGCVLPVGDGIGVAARA